MSYDISCINLKKKAKELIEESCSDCLKFLPKLQSQFNALCNCKITNVQKASLIILRAYFLLLRDSIHLYTLLSDVVMKIYNNYNDLSKKEKPQFIEIFKLFVKETNAIVKIYDGAKSISSSLPTVEKVDEKLLETMQQDIDNNGGGDDNSGEEKNIDNEDLLGTNKDLLLNTNNSLLFQKTTNNDKSGSSESSGEGGDETNVTDNFLNFFNSVPKTVISNQPKHNPFLTSVESNPSPQTGGSLFTNNTTPFGNINQINNTNNTNNTSPFDTFGQTNNNTNNTSPFGNFGQTNNYTGGTSLFGTSQTIFGTPTVYSTNNDPFSSLLTQNMTNNPPKKENNPFGTTNTTTTQTQQNNPFVSNTNTQTTQQPKKTNNPFL